MAGLDNIDKSLITLSNGALRVKGFKQADYKALFQKLHVALLDGLIPYATPVAMQISFCTAARDESYISKIQGINKSLVEIMIACRDLIYAEPMGDIAEGLRCEVSKDYGAVSSIKDEVESSNGSLFVFRHMEQIPRPLINNVKLFSYTEKSFVSSSTTFLIRLGSGEFGFESSQSLIAGSKVFSYPLSAVYDLNHVFSIAFYDGGDCLRLCYKKDINEDVLQTILANYLCQEEEEE